MLDARVVLKPIDDVKLRLRWWPVATVVLTAGSILSSCSTSGSGPNTQASAPASGQIAVKYVVDLYLENLKGARKFVYPPDRKTFDVVSAIIRHNKVSARAVSVGSETVSGDYRGRSA